MRQPTILIATCPACRCEIHVSISGKFPDDIEASVMLKPGRSVIPEKLICPCGQTEIKMESRIIAPRLTVEYIPIEWHEMNSAELWRSESEEIRGQ